MALEQSQTDYANLALMRLGQKTIQDIDDQTDPNAIVCRIAWAQALGEVSRDAPWNCLTTVAYLALVDPSGIVPTPPAIPAPPDPWVPATNYVVNDAVTYAGQMYQCLIANTSGASFVNDLTKGYWFETTYSWPNYLGPFPNGNVPALYDWTYAYALPTDFILLLELNGMNCWQDTGNTLGDIYEIFQTVLYCDTPNAVIKYNKFEEDTTKFDTLFGASLVLNLASAIATSLRKDDSTLSQRLKAEYQQTVQKAVVQNAGERQPRRYNVVSQSRFVASRRRSTNG